MKKNQILKCLGEQSYHQYQRANMNPEQARTIQLKMRYFKLNISMKSAQLIT